VVCLGVADGKELRACRERDFGLLGHAGPRGAVTGAEDVEAFWGARRLSAGPDDRVGAQGDRGG
jgi:hypothetical protein